MNILNKEELRRQIREGKEISLDGILDEFKSLLRESLQTASEEELTSHLGYDKHQESDNPNYRNGHNKKSLKTKYGQVDVSIPRDRDGTFEPKLVPKRERLLKGSEDLILSLYAKGMSVRDIHTHLDDLYGYQLSEQTISNITEAIMDKAKEWLKSKGVTAMRGPANPSSNDEFGMLLEGFEDSPRIMMTYNPKYYLDLMDNYGLKKVKDLLAYQIDNPKLYPKAEIQRCIVHQIRSSLRYVSWKDRKAVARDLKTIYTAPTEEDAQLALTEFNDVWGQKYPHIAQSWLNNWNELTTFFKYPQSIKTLIYTTNPIESLNSNIKRKTKSKGSFPTIDSAFKMLYLSTQEVQGKWERSSMRNWSEIYPQLCIFFSEIMEKYTK